MNPAALMRQSCNGCVGPFSAESNHDINAFRTPSSSGFRYFGQPQCCFNCPICVDM